MDANFRLKSRLRANEHADLPLGSGWGYLVEERPYKEHLKGYVAEKDVSDSVRLKEESWSSDGAAGQHLYRICGLNAERHAAYDWAALFGGRRCCLRASRARVASGDRRFAKGRAVRVYNG
jgi:hypothetical protein